MKKSKTLCDRLAAILGGSGMSDGKSCSIMIERKLNARILGRRYETEHEVTIQSLHIETVENPIIFARKLRAALNVLKK